MDASKLIAIINKVLSNPEIEDLQAEVLTFAILAYEEDPELSEDECVNIGRREWDI